MDSTLSGYLLSMIFMLAILVILGARARSTIKQKGSRFSCLVLLGATAFYVVMDAAFIACHLSANVEAWKVVSFLFYISYVLLPFAWHVFVRNFVGNTFGRIIRTIELIPLVILLGMVIVNPFTGILWSFDAAGGYVRGDAFTFYSYLNYYYYVSPFFDLLVIAKRKDFNKEPYVYQAILISIIPLAGAFVNSSVIPVGTIFPFQPSCAVVVALTAFCFIASKDTDALKEQQQKAVQEALAKAEEAGRAKTRFLSDMSHDIRTPLNAIINLNELALNEKDPMVVRDYLEKMKISSTFLLGLINDILDMSRIESGEFVLKQEKLTRQEFLNTVETVIGPMVLEKNIHFHPELNPGEYTIGVDKLRFNQIFFNLLSNAVKYTPEGGDVWLEVNNKEVEGNRLLIEFVVRDNGIGMSEEFQKHLFEPFAREVTDANIRTRGTGLGLSIVKKLVDAMDGEISVKSALGEGSEFTVSFHVDILGRDEEFVAPEELPAEKDLSGLRVMLVEDNELNTFVAQTILEQMGCVVTAVDNGKKALDLFATSEPYSFDVILMDLRMPVMGGLDATKAIRALNTQDSRDIPIIAMTADVLENEWMDTLAAGMNYYLPKPISADSVYKALKMCPPPREKSDGRDEESTPVNDQPQSEDVSAPCSR